MTLIDSALSYLQAGLCILPASVAQKRPTLPSWKQYQKRLPTEQQVRTWFNESSAICILTGTVSGNLEVIDFDAEFEVFERWRSLVAMEMPGLIDRLLIQRTQSGGWHVVYRCTELISGNQKLAQRVIRTETASAITIAGKQYIPRLVGDQYEAKVTLIETRGDGGLFLCAPSPGYQLDAGSFESLAVISAAERMFLLEAARALDEVLPEVAKEPENSLQKDVPAMITMNVVICAVS